MERIPHELKDLLVKIIIPSLVAVSIQLAVKIKKQKISFFNAFLSAVIGVGCAYLSSGWVLSSFEDATLPIACITVIGEKVAYWLIYQFNFDVVGDSIIQYFIEKYKKK
jgi:hypothetical protein